MPIVTYVAGLLLSILGIMFALVGLVELLLFHGKLFWLIPLGAGFILAYHFGKLAHTIYTEMSTG